MLTVEGLNRGVSILKIGLFTANLRAIQSSFMAHKWTTAMQFSFEYCIDHKDLKSKEEYTSIAVEGAIWPKL